MNLYKRAKQISDEAILAFKDQEIAQIEQRIELSNKSKQPSRGFLRFIPIGFSVIAVLVVSLLFLRPRVDDPTYEIVRLSQTQFEIVAKEEAFAFRFYYGAYVAKEGGVFPVDANFELFAPYLFVTDIDAIDLPQLKVYKANQFTYYMEVRLMDEVRWLEVQYFKRSNLLDQKGLDGLEIVDFEADFSDLNEWLEMYPPIHQSEFAEPSYLPHESVLTLTDSRAKRNYLAYVALYYTIENTYGVAEYQQNPVDLTLIHRHVVILDGNDEVIDDSMDVTFGFSLTEAMRNQLLDTTFYDYMEYWPLIPPSSNVGISLHAEEHGKNGSLAINTIGDAQYYSVILHYADSRVAMARLTVTLKDGTPLTGSQSVSHFNNALLFAPLNLSDQVIDIDEGTAVVYRSFRIEYFDASNELLFTVEWDY